MTLQLERGMQIPVEVTESVLIHCVTGASKALVGIILYEVRTLNLQLVMQVKGRFGSEN